MKPYYVLPVIAIAIYTAGKASQSFASVPPLASLFPKHEKRLAVVLRRLQAEYKVSIPTIEAIAFVESSFNPKAIAYNPKDEKKYGKMGSAAHGLMQIRGFYAGTSMCPEASTYEDLYNPEINLICGTRHYSYNLGQVKGDSDLAHAAYYAGPKCTKQGKVCKIAQKYVQKINMRLASTLGKK